MGSAKKCDYYILRYFIFSERLQIIFHSQLIAQRYLPLVQTKKHPHLLFTRDKFKEQMSKTGSNICISGIWMEFKCKKKKQ